MAIFKRKLYRRGSSFETTIPMALLFQLELEKKHNVIFEYDKKTSKWTISFEEIKDPKKSSRKNKKR